MSGNRHGRDPFDDDRTEFIGRDEPTRFTGGGRDAGRGDQPTEYIGREPGRDPGYDLDADFGGGAGSAGRGADETRAVGRDGSGQYWAPLTPEERGVDPRAAAGGAAGGTGGYPPADGGYRDDRYRDDREGRDYRDGRAGRDGRGSGGMARGATIIGVVAIIAIVVLVALMFGFLSGNDDEGERTPTTPPPAPSSSTTATQSTTETSDPVQDELDRLRDEVNSLRETPPAIPGLGGGEVVEATVPDAVGKSPAEAELSLRRAGFGDITILDANGNRTNSLSALTGRVSTIDPPSGTATTTDQAITITLE